MAKCTICNSRKGKRKCQTTGTIICSLCCGQFRAEENCGGCLFFTSAPAARNYRNVPYYATREMAAESNLERIAQVIEATLCQVWANDPQHVDDRTAARLVEMMIDKHHFSDEEPRADTPVLADGFRLLLHNTGKALPDTHPEQLVKVLAAVYRSIQRRTMGGASYLQFVNQFTGTGPFA